jgi:hypothetical protein
MIMKHRTLRAKLIALLTVSVTALILVGAVGWTRLENTGASLSEIVRAAPGTSNIKPFKPAIKKTVAAQVHNEAEFVKF